MSQLGPGCNPSSTEKSEKKLVQGMQEFNTVCCVPHNAVRPLMLQQSEIVAGCGDTDCSGDANMGMASEFDIPPCKFSDAIFSESPHGEGHEEIPPPFQVHHPSPLVPYQMGLWTHQHMDFVPRLGPGSRQDICAEGGISPVDFLDVCFFCKRRLKHERDIFIYRGDSAFCSEECRHRQILSDERRSLRGGNKRGGARATSSETAVAA